MKDFPLFRLSLTLFMLIVLTACGRKPAAGSDETEKDHIAIQEAKEKVKLQDPDGAILILETLIREEPDFAYAHLQLGFAFQIKREPVKALYHFQRYLEQRPESGNAEVVRSVVRDELKRLAARVGVPGGLEPQALLVEELEQKLRDSRRELARLSILLEQAGGEGAEPEGWAEEKLQLLAEIERLRSQSPGSSGSHAGGSSSGGASETRNERRTYVVQRGDNLSLISKKMYGRSSDWKKIYDANRTLLPSTRALKPGQELVIPE